MSPKVAAVADGWKRMIGKAVDVISYDDLPDDNAEAFFVLEAEYRKTYEAAIEGSEGNWQYHASDYINQTLSAAEALNIEGLGNFRSPASDSQVDWDNINAFRRAVDRVIIQMRIQRGRHGKAMSVGLNAEQKTKIHVFIEKIREEVEASTAGVPKKEKLFVILANLAKEVDRPRTGFERFGDLARGLAGISKEVEREGARPWWPYFDRIMGIVDGAKEAEPQLSKPAEVKQIEPPRKELPKPDVSELDDDIPF